MTVNINFIKREEKNRATYLLIGIGILLFILVIGGSFGWKLLTDYRINIVEAEIQINKVKETEADMKQLMFQTQQKHINNSIAIRDKQFPIHQFYTEMLALVPSTIEYREIAYMKEDIWFIELAFEDVTVITQLINQWEEKNYIDSIEIIETIYGDPNTLTLNLHVNHDGFIAEVTNEME